MNEKKLSAILFSLSIFFVMSVVLVSAQCTGEFGSEPCPPTTEGGISLQNPLSSDTLFGLLQAIIDGILLPIGGVLAVLAFIYSGFLYVTAQGNESKLATAHKALLYSAVGTAVLLGSWVIAKVLETTINQLR
jgi:hypothetical protein